MGPAGVLVGGSLAGIQVRSLDLSVYAAYVNTFYAASIILAFGTILFAVKVARMDSNRVKLGRYILADADRGIIMLEYKTIRIEAREGCNVILGMAHFIKTVEDLYEALVNAVPNIKFGVGFCESSGPCLVRHEGTDDELRQLAAKTAFEIGCGHSFIIFLKNAYPINVLDKIKKVPEVCTVYAATANPLEIIIAETQQGRGIVCVVDGSKSQGIETQQDIKERKEFLRKIGYKLN